MFQIENLIIYKFENFLNEALEFLLRVVNYYLMCWLNKEREHIWASQSNYWGRYDFLQNLDSKFFTIFQCLYHFVRHWDTLTFDDKVQEMWASFKLHFEINLLFLKAEL